MQDTTKRKATDGQDDEFDFMAERISTLLDKVQGAGEVFEKVEGEEFTDYLKQVEGKGDTPVYEDMSGNKTYGYGHLVQEGEDFSDPKYATEEYMTDTLIKDVVKHEKRAAKVVGKEKWDKLDINQRQMLTDMEFNPGLSKFPNFTKAVLDKDWDRAKVEYERSARSKQTGKMELLGRNKVFYDRFLADLPPTSVQEYMDTVGVGATITSTTAQEGEVDASILRDTQQAEVDEFDFMQRGGADDEEFDFMQGKAPDADATPPEGIPDALPNTLQIGLPVNSIFGVGKDLIIDTSIDISPEMSSFLVGMGHAATLVPNGIRQWLGYDKDQMAMDEKVMDELYANEEVGGFAKGGLITGAVIEPVGLLLPGIKGSSAAKNIVKAAGVSGLYGAAAYTKVGEGESFAEEKIKQVAVYTALGGAAGVLFGGALSKGYTGARDMIKGKGIDKDVGKEIIAAYTRSKGTVAKGQRGKVEDADVFLAADKQMDALDYKMAKEMVAVGGRSNGKEIIKKLKEEDPKALDGLGDATKITGRTPTLSMDLDDAKEIVKYYESKSSTGDIKALGDSLAGMMSTRIGMQSMAVRGAVQKFEAVSRIAEHQALSTVTPFMESAAKVFGRGTNAFGRNITKDKKEYAEFTQLLHNGDFVGVKNMLGAKGLGKDSKEYKQLLDVEAFLAEQGEKLYQAGLLSRKSLKAGYFPRVVKDIEGLKEHLGSKYTTGLEKAIQDANKRTLKSQGRKLSPSEENAVINQYLVKYPRGVQVKGGRHTKKRSIDYVTPEMAQFYEDPLVALNGYIRNTTQNIHKANLFGKNARVEDVGGVKFLHTQDSIGAMLKDDIKAGRVDPMNVEELQRLLNIRFGIGEEAPNKIIQGTRNVLYTALLANPISAAVQLGDVAVSMYVNGFKTTLEALGPATKSTLLARPGQMRGAMKDLGLLDNVTAEFIDVGATATILKKSMQWSGFTRVDAFGKEVAIQAATLKARKAVSTEKGLDTFIAKHKPIYGDDVYNLANALRDGKVTEDVKVYLFSELSRMQPISKLELPEAYHKVPNMRIAYMLKSFMLKQVDLVRRDAVQKIGNPATRREGYRNLMGILIALGAGGTTSSTIQEFMRGNPDALDEITPISFVLNSIKTFGWSEYALDKASKGKVLEATVGIVMPPLALPDRFFMENGYKYLPVGGQVTYYWVGGGMEKAEERRNKLKDKQARKIEKAATTRVYGN